ncbi:MAG: hypothetical protein JNM84_20945 [Planctomycetes bacterium]|nr:hypothetical protein [Planctomycetota bacterium]
MLLLALLCGGCPSVRLGPPEPEAVEVAYAHPPTGAAFPRTLAGCPLVRLWDEKAPEDVSANYESLDLERLAFASIYLYARPPRGLEPLQHQHSVIEDVRRAHPDAEVGDTREVTVEPSRGGRFQGMRTEFTYSMLLGGSTRRVRSFAYLFAWEAWYLKFRVTYALDQEERVRERSERFVIDFPWPTELSS